jgi:hypothetical protein
VEPYQVYLNIDLLEAVPKSGRQRQEIMKFITACVTGRGLKATIPIGTPRSKSGRLKSSVTTRSRTGWMMR